MNTKTARIIEQGNGFAGVEHAARLLGEDGSTLYRITSRPGTIHTDDSRGNYVRATVEEDGDVSDLSDEEFAALPAVRLALE